MFNIVLAVGSVGGALIAGGRTQTRLWMIAAMAAGFGLAQLAAALAPGILTFLAAIALMGAANLAFQAMANASVQMGVDAAMRGRVMGLYMLAFTGGTPLGAPLIGWITSTWGPRVGMAVCGVVPLAAALAVLLVVGHTRARSASVARWPARAVLVGHSRCVGVSVGSDDPPLSGRRRDRAAAPGAAVSWLLSSPLHGRGQHGSIDLESSLRAGQLIPLVSKPLAFTCGTCAAPWGRLDCGSDQHRDAQQG